MFGPLWFAVVKEGASGSVWLNRMQQRLKCVLCFRASSALTSRGWRVCGWAVWCRSAWSSRWSRGSTSSTTCWIKRSTHRRSAASSTTTSWRASAASAGSDHNRLITNKPCSSRCTSVLLQRNWLQISWSIHNWALFSKTPRNIYLLMVCQ